VPQERHPLERNDANRLRLAQGRRGVAPQHGERLLTQRNHPVFKRAGGSANGAKHDGAPE
jgi:hypothetical protein